MKNASRPESADDQFINQPTDHQTNGLMSLREDKTQNILKNYTNLVNRLKQSQKDRDTDQDKQVQPLPPSTPLTQQILPRDRSEFQNT